MDAVKNHAFSDFPTCRVVETVCTDGSLCKQPGEHHQPHVILLDGTNVAHWTTRMRHNENPSVVCREDGKLYSTRSLVHGDELTLRLCDALSYATLNRLDTTTRLEERDINSMCHILVDLVSINVRKSCVVRCVLFWKQRGVQSVSGKRKNKPSSEHTVHTNQCAFCASLTVPTSENFVKNVVDASWWLLRGQKLDPHTTVREYVISTTRQPSRVRRTRKEAARKGSKSALGE